VIGSGTVGSGCILELTPQKTGGWLQAGDRVVLIVERLGRLENVVGSPASV
jgi:fumarylacetoacetate (FAA) hydrolase